MSESIEERTLAQLDVAAALVRYSDHMEYEVDGSTKELGADEFISLARLAFTDLFYRKMKDREKAALLSTEEKTLKPTTLARARGHPKYEDIREDLWARALSLSTERGIERFAEEFEDNFTLELAHQALFSKSSREQIKAIEGFVDRRSAKKGREGEQKLFRIPPEFEELLAKAVETVREHQPEVVDAEYEEISASRVNVPQIEE